jgi:hypothetical protein
MLQSLLHNLNRQCSVATLPPAVWTRFTSKVQWIARKLAPFEASKEAEEFKVSSSSAEKRKSGD